MAYKVPNSEKGT